MGLYANGYRLGNSPFRYRCGALLTIYNPSTRPRALDCTGAIRGSKYLFGDLAALPQGAKAPGAWMLPQVSGGMASHNLCDITVSAAATGALGFNLAGTSTLTIGASGVGGLIAGGVGTASLSIGASADIAATVGGVGTATITLSASAVTGALGWLQGASEISLSGAIEPYAIGWMTGTTAEAGLSVPGIVNAVWGATATDYTTAGTMGQKLNNAASGGVDYDDLAQAVWEYELA